MTNNKRVFFSLLKVGSSPMSRAAVLPDKRKACIVKGKDFACLPKGGIDQETICPCVRFEMLETN